MPSIENQNQPESDTFRNYRDSARQANVAALYRDNHAQQTLDFVKEKKNQFKNLDKIEMSIWQAVTMLTEMVDERYVQSPTFLRTCP